MKAKAKKMSSGEPHEKVDASLWTPPEMLNAGAKTGMRPLTERAYKRGGKAVGYCAGGEAMKHAGRKPRKSGGRTIISDMINRNAKKANQYRPGGDAHVGGMKRGGRTHKMDGGMMTGARNPVPSAMLNPYGGRGANVRPPMGGMKKGGAAKSDAAQDKAMIKKAIRQHDEHMHGGKHEDIKLKHGGKAGEKWIAGAIKHPGSLRKALHVKEGQNIPAKKLAKAAHSDNPKLAKRARLAQTLKRMHKADGGWMGEYDTVTPEMQRALDRIEYQRGLERMKTGSGPAAGRGDVTSGPGGSMMPKAKKSGGKAESKEYNYLGGTRPTGGRIAKAHGGALKKKAGRTNISINIQQPQPQGLGGMMPQQGPTPGPRPLPVAPPGMGAAPVPMAGMPPGMPPMGAGGPPPGMPGMPPEAMPRKAGGRVYRSYEDMDAGAGSALGRLEKTEIQKRK
jgi:hypothetical protein